MANNSLKGKHIVLGITGSIAAYKSCTLARLLIKAGAEVQVVMTPSAKEFITPLALATLTKHAVVSEFFDRRDGSWHSHVDLGLWADAMVVAPATASTIAKFANGVADNMLVTTYLSMRAPVFVAPAMDLDMYAHPATQNNIKTITTYGNKIISPEIGELASGLQGKGRMEEPEQIVEFLDKYFTQSQQLLGKKILITAGPTYEKIDPVRFIGNYSSGKMGYALAEECAQRGAEVVLISGPVALSTHNSSIRVVNVESANQMYSATITEFSDCYSAILCAAVADFTPKISASSKIKREKGDMILHLVPTKDIAAELGKLKRKDQHLIGFALETDNERNNAIHKLESKNLDFIVLNSLKDKGAGFAVDTNKISIISKKSVLEYPLKPKSEVANDIIDELCKL